MAKIEYIHAQCCPECGKSILYLKPVGRRAMDAALAILRGAETSVDVARELQMSPQSASDAIRRAIKSGLVRVVNSTTRSERGGVIYHYSYTSRLRAYVPTEYKQRLRRAS